MHKKKSKRVLPTWISYCIFFSILLFCALASSAAASRIARSRFLDVQAENTLSSVRASLESADTALTDAVDSALLMNTHALDRRQFDIETLPAALRSYTIYTTLRNAAGVAPYIQYVTLIDSSRNLAYDSMANVQDTNDYFDADAPALAARNRDTGEPPIDTLGVYFRQINLLYRKSTATSAPWNRWSCMTVLLSRKDGWHIFTNVNLNALWKSLSDTASEGSLAPFAPRFFLVCGNGSVISSYENASAEEIACAQTLGELSYDSRGYAVWDNGERYRVVRIVNSSYDLTYYALVSDAAIAAATSDALASLQVAQIGLFSAFTAIFALLLLCFMRPIAYLLQETLGQARPTHSAVFSVNEMLETVATRSKKLMHEEETARPFYMANLLSGLMTDRELAADPALFSSCLDSLAQYGVKFPENGVWRCALLSLSGDTVETADSGARGRYIVQRLDALLTADAHSGASRCGFAVELAQGRFGAALCTDSEDTLADIMRAALREITAPLGVPASAAVGRRVDGLSRLRKSYETASDALSYRCSFDADEVIEADRLHIRRGILEEFWQQTEDGLLRSIWAGRVESAQETLTAFFGFIAENRYSIYFRETADVTIALGRVVLAAALESKSARRDGETSCDGIFSELFRMLSSHAPRPELMDCCLRLVADAACSFRVSPEAAGSAKKRHELTVSRICAYIDENYASELSLGTLSSAFGYNASYLSTMFRETTGVGFPQYLENRRLEEAARLLRTGNLRVSQIAEQVGYRSVTYFTTAFRKKYGISPDKYRSVSDTCV
ncbi:MAG: helix-turn-helix domain-containing protein [Clostridiales bacterium]|nr:helix-turn-helix domain-containing protein [Clostridiales bacterium]